MTCGFAQDFEPNPEQALACHPWMEGLNWRECPACHLYLQRHGGRKNGKIEMPDITVPGVLVDEAKVSNEVADKERDFQRLTNGDASLLDKYEGQKLWGWAPSEILALKAKRDFEASKKV